MSADKIFCVNHPQTETLLRCNKCGNPVCIKCVVRTPVGYRCKTCMNVQQAGYYNANVLTYIIAGVVGLVVSFFGGIIANFVGGFWYIMFFFAPAAGGVIAEIIRRAIQKQRGKYLWLVACATFVIGAILGTLFFPIVYGLFAAEDAMDFAMFAMMLTSRAALGRLLMNIGLWIYIVLGVGTVYARLR